MNDKHFIDNKEVSTNMCVIQIITRLNYTKLYYN